MKLTYIQMHGFRGFRDLTRVDIPPGFAIIFGPNGVGKSTLCDAVEFALTGTILGSSEHSEKGESIHDYLWWRGVKAATENHVEIGLISPEGEVVRVRRSATKLTVIPHASLKELLLNAGSALENPLLQLCQTAILRDEKITRLSVDFKETERFEFVRAALGTADFRATDEGAQQVTRYLKQHHEAAQRDYALQRDRLAELTTRLSQAKTQAARVAGLSEAESTLKRYLGEPTVDVDDLFAKSQRAVAIHRQRVDGLKRAYTHVTEIASQLAQLATPQHLKEIDELESVLRVAEVTAEKANAEGKRLLAEVSNAQAQSSRSVSLAQLVEHGGRLGLQNGECPLCGASQAEDHFIKHLEILRATLNAADSRLAALSRESADATQRAYETVSRVAQMHTQLFKLKGSEELLKTEFAKLIGEIESLGLKVSNDPSLAGEEVAARIESLQSVIVETESALAVITASHAAAQVVELEREAAVVKIRLVSAEKLLAEVIRAQSYLTDARQIIKRLQGELVDEQLAALSPLLVELYERLRPHVDWQKVRYNLRGDVRRMLSLEVGAGLNPSFVFSSGQRRAAGLAFLIAIFLSRSWCKLKTLVLDDPVQHVDDYRVLHLTEVLAAVRRTGHQIVCTVEDRALAELLARRLRSDFDDQGAVIQLSYQPGDGAQIEQVRTLAPLTRQVLVAS